MLIGDRNNIDLGSSDFKRFIENNNLYIDKSIFIEHILQDSSSVLLFTRPRRMGKSLNLDMLTTFLDFHQKSKHLFKNLHIESSTFFKECNQHPVIHLDFKNYSIRDFKYTLENDLAELADSMIPDEQINIEVKLRIPSHAERGAGFIVKIMKNIYDIYGKQTYIIIDEYDKVLMDNLNHPDLEELKSYISQFLTNALKGNKYLARGILTGVSKITKESMFSGLNNIVSYDIFTPSIYDDDFSLTDADILDLVNQEHLQDIKEWYNNMRIGNSKLYNIYSVMSYLKKGTLDPHWVNSGTMSILSEMIKTPDRLETITKMLLGKEHIIIELQPDLELRQITVPYVQDKHFYTLAIQAGYLTYDPIASTGNSFRDRTKYKVYIPNHESWFVWHDSILEKMHSGPHRTIYDVFSNIRNTSNFSMYLSEFLSFQLSFFDTGKEIEAIYHSLVFGMLLTLRYDCTSNGEAGLGRYDLYVKSPEFGILIEFKMASSVDKLNGRAIEALKQIDNKMYYQAHTGPTPLYKIGIACYKKQCLVITAIHK